MFLLRVSKRLSAPEQVTLHPRTRQGQWTDSARVVYRHCTRLA